MNRLKRRAVSLTVLFFFFLLQAAPFLPSLINSTPLTQKLNRYSLFRPEVIDAAGLSSASATLSNPRLSFSAGVSTSYSTGATVIVISGSGNADNDTNHLFPNDYIGVGGNYDIQVASLPTTTSIVLKTALTSGITSSHKIYSTQSGTLAVNFYTSSAIPLGGSIEIDIPASATTPNDGTPDTAAIGSNGFDLNFIGASDITCPAGFTAAAPTAGSGGDPHKIYCNLNGSALPAGANLTVTVGTATKGLVNPAPSGITHVQGVADTYLLNIYTKSGTAGGGVTVESVPVKVAPVEGVLVSASIDETLNFTVAAVTSANLPTTCGFTPAGTLITTTATSVPFGASVTANTFYNGAQQLTVSTNAPGGYSVKVEENDQMGKDGKVCTGATADEADNCIEDTLCNGGACTYDTSADWSTNTVNGLGYSLSNVSGNDASFLRDELTRTFSAKHFPDQEASQAKEDIMSATGVRSGSSACIVYRLSVSGTQPAGYYYNKIKYTASAKF